MKSRIAEELPADRIATAPARGALSRLPRSAPLLALVLALALATSCGGGSAGPADPPVDPPADPGGSGDDGDDGGTNSPPAFTSGAQAAFPENGTGTVLTLEAADPDGDAITFAIAGGPDAAVFVLDAASGALDFATPPDFEAAADADGDNQYILEVEARDSHGAGTSQELGVTVTDTSHFELVRSYPPPGGNLGGYTSETTVTGAVLDLEDGRVDFADVAYIDVNGETAVQDASQPGRWSVRTAAPIPGGQVSVSFRAMDGSSAGIVQPVLNTPLLLATAGLALDAGGDRAYTASGALDTIVSLQLPGGKRELVVDGSAGGEFGKPTDVALDAANNRLLVTDDSERAVFAVDLATGGRSVLSDNSTGTGPAPGRLACIALDPPRNRALVVNDIGTTLSAVDLASGDRAVLSDATTGSGPVFVRTQCLAVDTAKGRALVFDEHPQALYAVDLATGNRSVVSGAATGTGPLLDEVRDMVFDGAHDRVLAVADGSLAVIDLATGNRRLIPVLSPDGRSVLDIASLAVTTIPGHALAVSGDLLLDVNTDTGAANILSDTWNRGPHFGRPYGLSFDPAGKRLLLTDTELQALFAVDAATGDRTILSDASTGSGPAFQTPRDVEVDPQTGLALLSDSGAAALVTVDPATGERTLLSDAAHGSGPAFSSPDGIAVDAAQRRALVADTGLDALLAVDLATGDRSIVSGTGTGSGPAFNTPRGVAIDATGEQAIVVDYSLRAVIVVDLATGDRSILAEDGFEEGIDVAIDSARNRVLVVDELDDPVVAFDLTTGARSVVADPGDGLGHAPVDPAGIAIDPANGVAYVAGDFPAELVVIELGSGERALLSR